MDPTQSLVPVRDPALPVDFSGSSWTRLDDCALRWFLEHEVKGDGASGPVTAFGSVVHALADAISRGEISSDRDSVQARAEQVWDRIGYTAKWHAAEELGSALSSLAKFATWHDGRPDRTLIASEAPFVTTFDVARDEVRVRGAADRLELDHDGGIHVVDLKTQRSAPSAREVSQHRQLAMYQLVADEGAFLELTPELDGALVAGAELVQLRIDGADANWPKVQQQAVPDFDELKLELSKAIAVVRDEAFDPSPSSMKCRTCQFQRVCPSSVAGRQVLA